jgi:RNA polymerase sigma factor (TIGR02999 family)
MSAERSNHTLCPTELVHQAYVRLVDNQANYTWVSRGHFFSAAAEAMRRILVEHARRRNAIKRGGAHPAEGLPSDIVAGSVAEDERILSVSDALEVLSNDSPRQAELIKLRYFGGLTLEEAAQSLNISLATAKRDWASAKVFIYRRISE